MDDKNMQEAVMTVHFASLAEIKKQALRQSGNVAVTDNAIYKWDGSRWTMVALGQYVTFEVVARRRVTGRGYVTVIHNPDLLPVDENKSAVCKGQFRLPIHGIERAMSTESYPEPLPDWGIVTYEETLGDEITIRMYPDEKED